MRAPEFPRQASWLNTPEPISLEALRGQVVLLDFWTYCCINCLHVLPVLERLEREFADRPFMVIGVHAAKFNAERDAENIRKAVHRHGVEHPVLVDSDHDLWQQYAIKAWPTLVLIDSAGRIVETIPGEPTLAGLREKIEQVLARGREDGTLADLPVPIERTGEETGRVLSFPGKVRHCPAGDDHPEQLIVTDTGHHRVLLCDLVTDGDGWPRISRVDAIGSGAVGWQDGSFGGASFRRPQGAVRVGETLYICDTENYVLRRADLKSRTVSTVAGNGSRVPDPQTSRALETSLRSPWDCAELAGQILIAMAGSHQLWVYKPKGKEAYPVVGSGWENHVDGEFAGAALAQPSSLDVFGPYAVFADSEISSIRIADFHSGKVMSVMGRGLFDFGDVDGPLQEALLQHPLGVVHDEGVLWVADTFNNKIKRIDLSEGTIATFIGDDSSEVLHEPGGIDEAGRFLFIADTNNHRVRVASKDSAEVRTLEIPAGQS